MKKKNIIAIIILLIIVLVAGFIGYRNIEKNKKEYQIEKVSEYNYFVVKEDDKYGVIDRSGTKIIDTSYDNVVIPNPSEALFICYSGEQTEVFNDKKEKLFQNYDTVEPLRLKGVSTDLMYEKSVLKYSKNGKYGIINFNGKKITNANYNEIDTLQFKEGELLVKKDNKYGVINIKGAELVKTNYDKIEADKYYKENIGYKDCGYIVSITTNEGYRYGYINKDGKELLKTEYNDLYRILEANSEEPYLICAQNGKYGLYKNSKKIIDNEYQSLRYDEFNNRIIALKGKQYGVFTMDGKQIVPFKYSQIDVTGENIYATDSNGKVKVFDNNGKETSLDYNTVFTKVENTSYKINISIRDNKVNYSIYKNNEKKTNKDYNYIEYLYDDYFLASNSSGKLGVIDENEDTKIQFKYNTIQKIENTNLVQATDDTNKVTEIYSKDMEKIIELKNATVEEIDEYIKLYNENETKYITRYGKELKDTEVFVNNKIFAKKQGNYWGFVDINGKTVVDFKYEKVTEVNKYGFAGIKKDGKWGVIDKEGKIIVEPKYELKSIEQPDFIGQYYKFVYGNGEIYYTNK